MESSKELKREAVGRLRLMLPSWEERLREIDGRLVTYFEGLCWESGYGEGEKDLHNVYEVLAGLRFLRQVGGQRTTDNGQRTTDNGQRTTEQPCGGRWTDNRGRTTDYGQRTEDRQRTTDNR